jgi:hypothetical protein
MGVKKVVEIDVKITDGVAKVENVTEKVKELDKTAKKTSKNQVEGVKKTSAVMEKLNDQTGGLSNSLLDVARAAKKGGTEMRAAFIASGIGILVIALGFVVAHWEDIKDLIDSSNKDLQRRIDLNHENLENLERELTLLESQEGILKLKNNSTKEIREKQKDILKLQAEQNLLLLENLETQLQKEKAQNREVTFWEKTKILASSYLGINEQAKQIAAAYTSESERTKEIEEEIYKAKKKRLDIEKTILEIDKKNTDDDDKLSEEERKAKEKADRAEALRIKQLEKELEAERKRLDAIEKVREEFEDRTENLAAKTLEEKLALDKKRALEDLENLIGTETEKREAKLAIEQYYNKKEDELREQRRQEKKKKDEEDEKEAAENRRKQLEEEQRLADAKAFMQQQLARNIGDALFNISQLFDQSTAMGKAAAIADVAIGTGIGFINALDIAQKSAKATGPAAAFAFPVFYASQVASVLGAAAQAKRILSTAKTKGGGGAAAAPSVPAAQAPPPSPSFNLVGNSQANQLAGALNRQDQPVRAYVVSRNMTTQQEMDRNIRNTASVG